jgi:hypothetical protein
MRLLNSILNNAKRSDSRFIEFDGNTMDVVIFPSGKWPRMGLVLGSEALILDYKTSMSFRVRSGNLGFSKDLFIGKSKIPIDKKHLDKYFLENRDNPYGIQNIMNMIHRGLDMTTASQFPPLFLPKLAGEERKREIEKLVKLAQKGDMVFSSHRHDAISAAIRKYDRSQFSHVAPYLGGGEVADVGPQGGEINSLFDSDDDTHFALYTHQANLPEVSRDAMAKKLREKVAKGIDFNYRGLFLMFLRKRFKLPVLRNTPSVADLLFSNCLQLVAYL